jgi:hypothetical protein
MNERGRLAGECQVDRAFLDGLMKKQKGLCYYSKLPMFSGPDVVDWKCTIERLDDSIGYLPSNVVLCCFEFNVTAKWTLAKISAVWALRQQAADLAALQPVLQCLKVKRPRADQKRVYRDLSHLSPQERATVKFVQGVARVAGMGRASIAERTDVPLSASDPQSTSAISVGRRVMCSAGT